MDRNSMWGWVAAAVVAWLACGAALAGEPLQIVLSGKGVQSLKYRGVEYCDPSGCGELGFTGGRDSGNVWAPCVLDTRKNKAPFSTTPASVSVRGNVVTQTYPWGRLAATYEVEGQDLRITATLSNTCDTDIGWWKANLLQLNGRLVFDRQPWDKVMPYGYTPNMHWDYHWFMWGMPSDEYDVWNFTDPHVYWWVDRAAPFDREPVKVMFADLDPRWQTGVYHMKTDRGDAWPVCGSSINEDPGSNHTPLKAGKSETVRMAIRFRPATESAIEVCRDGYEAWGRAYPRTVTWTDRRPIGTYFACRGNNLGGTNTNGWFNDKTVDIDSPAGRKAFAGKLLAEIDTVIGVLKDVGAQGVIWWDLEGARNPHPVTYIGDPRVLDPAYPHHDRFVPELDTEVVYGGGKMKLVDACFRKFQDAGLKTGVTIRPQTVVCDNGGIRQAGEDSKLGENLLAKAVYARKRWGCTIFYVDSISEWFGNWWLEPLVNKYNDVLLLPEWARTRSYRHGSQFSYTKFTGFYRGVPEEMQACWPDAFCAMSNYDFGQHHDDAVHAVRKGNLLLFNCWYMSDEGRAIKRIYEQARTRHIPVAEDQKVSTAPGKAVRITLRATDEDNDAVTYALLAPPEHGTLTGLDAKTGTVTYTPARGYAGPDSFTFKATDATGLDSGRATVSVVVGGRGK